jgi:hypothetical protein
MSDPLDDVARRTGELQARIRAFLFANMAQERPDVVASAMVYELVNMIAASAETEAQAHYLIDQFAKVAHVQIAAFGVEAPHP